MTETTIEWTRGDDGSPGATWNPVSGCSKVSQGCKNCYAERVFPRPYPGRDFTDVRTHSERLEQPLRWRRPRRVFVNSMSDLFHEAVPFEFIASVFAIMGVKTRHTFQVLTKRPARMLEFFQWAMQKQDDDGSWYALKPGDFDSDSRIFEHWPRSIPWDRYDTCGPVFPYENVWLGVSVEDQETADERIPLLLQTPAAVRFISAEPLLGPINLTEVRNTAMLAEGQNFINALGGFAWTCDGPDYVDTCGVGARLDWVIAGGESGPKARPCDVEWIRGIVADCQIAGIPVFVKQLGARATGWCFGNCDSDGIDCSTAGFSSTPIGCQSFESSEGGECPDGRCCMRRDRKGGDPNEWPADLRVREFPT